MALLGVALTGGIAEGKTTVLRMLSEFGLSTASSDEVAREALQEPEVQKALAARLGVKLPLQRGELRTIVANDAAKRRAMNEVLHPEVFARLVELGADVVEVPLLIETCLQSSFRQVWVATCGPAEQRRRLLERHGDEGLVARLLSTQLPSVVKSAFADRTLRTDRPLASVQEEVAVIARELASR